GTQVSPDFGLLDQQPCAEADDELDDHHPAAIDRQEHEAEVRPAGVLAAPIYQVSPLMGSNMIIVVFAVVVVGGMGSIMGA
ncbi:hypothetical protein ACC809_37350, partial [Rhizobium johnstonii]